MAYIGVQPTDTYLSIASQQITGDGGATYTLNYSVSTEEDVAVFVNNVRQNVSSYTVSGDQLTLGGTISASDECWVLFLGRTVGTKTPAVGSVTNDMLAGSIATSKLADGSTFATTNGITMADEWRLTTDLSISNNAVYITSNWEQNDTAFSNIGTAMSESSGVFTFPTTGIYLIHYTVLTITNSNGADNEMWIAYTTDNSSYNTLAISGFNHDGESTDRANATTRAIFDVTDTSTHKLQFAVRSSVGMTFRGSSSFNRTFATFIRLGDT